MTKPTLPSSSSSSSSTQSSSEKIPTEPQQAQAQAKAQAVPTVAPAAGTGESTSTNSSSAVEATASATAATATAAVPASEGSSEAKREDEPTVRLGRSSWDERDDKSREGAAAHLFSPPPYKVSTESDTETDTDTTVLFFRVLGFARDWQLDWKWGSLGKSGSDRVYCSDCTRPTSGCGREESSEACMHGWIL